MITYYFSVLANFSFNGRARRMEYWWFVVLNGIVARLFDFAGTMLHWEIAVPDEEPISIPGVAYSLLTVVQTLAVTVRRFHDRSISGWWFLPIALLGLAAAVIYPLAAIALAIPVLIIAALPGTAGDNKYGADPKPEGI